MFLFNLLSLLEIFVSIAFLGMKITCIEDESKEIIDGTIEMIKRLPEMSRSRYDLRAARGLLEKWGIDPLKYNLVFDW